MLMCKSLSTGIHHNEDKNSKTSIISVFDVYLYVHMSHDKWQNRQNGMCAQRRLGSAWASAQSDQSLRCPHEESLGP